MKPRNRLDNPTIPLVMDASVAINLVATGRAREIVSAFANGVILVDVAHDELRNGHVKGRGDTDAMAELVRDGLVQVSSRSGDAWPTQ